MTRDFKRRGKVRKNPGGGHHRTRGHRTLGPSPWHQAQSRRANSAPPLMGTPVPIPALSRTHKIVIVCFPLGLVFMALSQATPQSLLLVGVCLVGFACIALVIGDVLIPTVLGKDP